MTNVIDDLSVLTTIPTSALQSLSRKSSQVIAYAVWENLMEKQTFTEVDIGIGTLCINVEQDGVRFKFVPSADMEQIVTKTAYDSYRPVIEPIEKRLKDRIMNTYKELF